MTAREQLLSEVEDFLKATGMAPTRFGLEAMGEPSLVNRLRKGSDVTLGTADRIRAFMRGRRKSDPLESSGTVAA